MGKRKPKVIYEGFLTKALQVILSGEWASKPQVASCKVCGRDLRAEKSIARGMGHVCAGKSKRDTMTGDLFPACDGDRFKGT
jgi:hypothetical protein